MAKRKEMVGIKFNHLLVIAEGGYNEKSKCYLWKCRCDCGNEVVVMGQHLRSGHTKSCGCVQKETVRKMKTTHGMDNTRLHGIWRSMLSRCYTKTSGSYKNYGARGITVCYEWLHDFRSFYNWAMENGYKENLYLERTDNNGNYEPSNCTWKTYKEQQRNKRNNHFITYSGETKTMVEWSEILGINYETLSYRLNIAKWNVERAFNEPVK